jgi:antitoxin component of MazEF toxin-antitoxin module
VADVKIQVSNIGQYTVTIPRNVAKLLDLKKGQDAKWKIGKNGTLELHVEK